MKKIILSLCMVLALGACKEENNQQAQKKPVIKIGATLPLTGNMANIGNAIKEALLMAKEEIPSNSKYNYELIIEDDGYDYKRTALNINNFADIKKADVVLSLFDGAAGIIAPVAERNKINHIGCAWGEKFFEEYKYSFNHFSKPETQAKAFVELLQEKDIKKFAIVAINYASMTEMLEYIEKDTKEKNIGITSVNLVNFGERDFRIIIKKIKSQNPDIVMLVMLNPELDIFIKQALEANLNKPYTAIDLLPATNYKELLEGTEFVMSPDGSADFKNKFALKTDLPLTSCVANLYDAVRITVELYEKYNTKPSSEQINNDLYHLRNFDSAIGGQVNVDENGIIDADLIRVKFEGGKLKTIKE